MDFFPFASLAHLRVLLLPVGNISRATYDKWATEIRTFENMRLSDIPPGTKDDKARFMPSPKSKGYLHLSFPSHPPPGEHFRMSLFRPSLFPLGVIGIASCSQTDSLSFILAEFNAAIADMFPPGSMFPLAKSCFVFEEGDGTTNLNLGDHLPGLVIIPSMMGNKKENIETLLADLLSNILGEFSVVMQTLESPLGNEYLNGTVFPQLPLASDMPKPLVDEPDSISPLPSHNSQPELARMKSPNFLKRTSSIGPAPNARQSALIVPRAPKRQSTIGVSSNAGRLFKVLGDFFLLAGRIEDASIWYTEAIVLFKSLPDAVWHGSALEGLAIVSMLESWSAGQGLQSSFSNSNLPWSEISSKLEQAVALYTKVIPSHDADQHFDLLVYIYVTAILRQSSLLFATWSAKGWGPLAFTAMLHPGPNPYIPPTLSSSDQDMYAARERLSTTSGISRIQVATMLAQAHGPWLLHLGHRERINVLETIASMYSFLGYHRKEAYVLREVIGCVMDLVVCGREEAGYGDYSPGFPSSVTNSMSFVREGDKGAVAVKETDRPDGNESIFRLVKYVCRVHGINLEAVSLSSDADGQSKPSDADSDEGIMADPYGWPELQIGIVREALAVAEALPDLPATAQIALSALKTLHAVLSEDDQMHFYSISTRALNIARRRGDKRSIEYWSGQPVVSIELMPSSPTKVLVENPVSVLTPRQERGTSILTGMKDPFLYNPRRLTSSQGRTLVVRNESLEFVVTLRNPYIFDLELQSLSLSTSGVPFESFPIPVIVPSNSYHSVTLTGKPLESGTLTVKGCFVQAYGSAIREFVIPLATQEEEDRRSKRRSTIALESGRSKYAGLDSRPWEKSEKRNSRQQQQQQQGKSTGAGAMLRFVECKVVPEQPLLRIRWSSLTHGAVMLYDGEKSTIRLTLENVSSLPVDFVRLSFEDSTIPPAQQALAEGEMSVFDTYETEYELISRPVFAWNHENEQTDVPPEKKTTVVIQCLGKAGCTSGVIHVAYGYVNRPQSTLHEPAEVFHTRRLSYPVLVTVYHMLECHHMNILPFNPFDGLPTHLTLQDGEDESGPESRPQLRKQLLRAEETGEGEEDEAKWCLFSVEVRNTYGLPFEVTFDRVQEGTQRVSTTCSVPPGSTTRVILPVKQFLLPEEVVTQPIPTLSDRQFVVAKTNLSSSEERAQRELFWYREELFKMVRGRWRETGGTRSGDLSLRQQRMSLPMLERLRTETVRVKMSMYSRIDEDDREDAWTEVRRVKDKYMPTPYDFVYLRTRVTNLSPNPLLLALDLSIDPSEHVIQEGISSGVPVGRVKSGETTEIETPLCFVACGRFEIGAEVRVAPLRREERSYRVGIGRMTALVRLEDEEET